MTLREHRALTVRWKNEQEVLDLRSGIIATAIMNSQGAKKSNDQPFMPDDFFPSLRHNTLKSGGVPGDTRAIRATQSVEEQIAAMESWTTLFAVDFKRRKAEVN